MNYSCSDFKDYEGFPGCCGSCHDDEDYNEEAYTLYRNDRWHLCCEVLSWLQENGVDIDAAEPDLSKLTKFSS